VQERIMRRLDGKRAIITGAGSGIGRASALRFAAEGAKVLVVGRTKSSLDETVTLVRDAGGVAETFVADAAQEDQVAAAVRQCITAFGGLEIFFANAGNTDAMVPLFEQTVEAWEGQFRDNVITAFVAVKHAGKHMVANGGGSIILNSSTGSRQWRHDGLRRGQGGCKPFDHGRCRLDGRHGRARQCRTARPN
jgi:NAD(P)-dependent dehydrogenase (short-subunit alcohol dehydrogenase family)